MSHELSVDTKVARIWPRSSYATDMNGLTGRLLKLSDLLQSHKRLTTEELAERLGVSKRTVRRDLVRLQELELNVEVTPGRGGGVTLQPGALLPALRFTDDEALALGFGLLLAGRAEGVALGQAPESAFKRLGGVLGERLKGRLEALARVLREPPAEQREAVPVASSLIFDLSEAAASRRRVELSYRASRGEITERRVDPYGLVHLGRYWYLTGFCHLRRDVRVFRLDRVRRAQTTEATFVAPINFDALGVVSRALAGTSFPGAVTCEVLLDCSLVEASRLIPEAAVTLEPEDAGVLLRVHVLPERLGEIGLYLLSFPFDVRVLGPQPLREALLRLSQRAAALADEMPTPTASR